MTHSSRGLTAGGDAPRTTRSADDSLGPDVKSLIEKGKERGYVTYDELNKVLPEDLVSPEKLDTVLQTMEDLGIEMVESSQDGGNEAEEERESRGAVER